MYSYPIRERITPYKVAIYLLISETDQFYTSEPLTNNEHLYIAFLIQALIRQSNLSYPALEAFLLKYIRWQDLMMAFLQRLHSYRTTMEPIIRLDSSTPKKPVKDSFVSSQSIIGIYVRKLCLQYQLCSESERNQFYQEWIGYMEALPTENEIAHMKKKWNIDLLVDEDKKMTK
uniref:Uncharacterized protein n=1 Tax=Acrobeloides nanus TaxID=290746 RepID=A0A914E6K0_9BILA